jgi:HTH-type transcriptional repressor of NAD biosynthesis genes
MEKKFKRGLVLGKFMPVHKGHLFLINTAIEQCENVFVMVCTSKFEPINGLMRYLWVKMIYEDNKNVEIIHVETENPQKPEECASTDIFYNEFWVPTVRKNIKSLDVVFTSEEYGDEFAQYLGIQHVLVDLDRIAHPISGTRVRNDAYTNWDFIPDEVKAYFTKRITIVGPESTGKTMLSKKLATHYGVNHIEEYGREYTEKIKSTKDLVKEDFYLIADRHDLHIVHEHATTTNKMLFVDTEALTTRIFGEMYISGYQDDRVDAIVQYQWFDLYILLDVDVPWVDDGTRDFPNERISHFNRIKSELDRLKKNYVVIKGNYDERFEQAVKVCDNLLVK